MTLSSWLNAVPDSTQVDLTPRKTTKTGFLKNQPRSGVDHLGLCCWPVQIPHVEMWTLAIEEFYLVDIRGYIKVGGGGGSLILEGRKFRNLTLHLSLFEQTFNHFFSSFDFNYIVLNNWMDQRHFFHLLIPSAGANWMKQREKSIFFVTQILCWGC